RRVPCGCLTMKSPDQFYSRHRVAIFVAAGLVLAFGALFGLAWSAGWGAIFHRFIHVYWTWVPIALGAEFLSYLGYTIAYREVTRAEGGAELRFTGAAGFVATGFGVFVAQGGFALDEAALKKAGLPGKEARARVLGLGTLEYVVLAPAAMIAAIYLVVVSRPDIDPGLTFP